MSAKGQYSDAGEVADTDTLMRHVVRRLNLEKRKGRFAWALNADMAVPGAVCLFVGAASDPVLDVPSNNASQWFSWLQKQEVMDIKKGYYPELDDPMRWMDCVLV